MHNNCIGLIKIYKQLKKTVKNIPVLNLLLDECIKECNRQKRRLEISSLYRKKQPVRVIIGASSVKNCKKLNSNWISMSIHMMNILNKKHWEKYFKKRSIDILLAEHVWEHLTPDEGKLATSLCFLYLKDGAYLRIAVPDGNHPSRSYIESVKVNGNTAAAKDHRILYTHDSLSKLLVESGFKIKKLEYFDELGNFIFNEWKGDEGMIQRSSRFDRRNKNGTLNYTSIIIDAYK